MTGNREPKDVESRLRAALHSYADVVDDALVQSPVRAGEPHRSSPLRGWRASVLAAAAALAVIGGTWVVVDGGTDPSSTAASGGGEAAVLDSDARAEAAPVPSTDSSAAAAGAEGAASAPMGALEELPSAEAGATYPFDLYTQCGVLGADIAGVWFAADQPLVERGGNPPPGWDNPYQRGTLTLRTKDVAVFRDDAGHELSLRAAEAERPPPCN